MRKSKAKSKFTESGLEPEGVSSWEGENPPPEILLEKALGETDRRLIEEYWGTIRVLRDEKNFSYREIADWLTENGVPADRNAVYRAYIKRMDVGELAETEQRDLEEAIDEQQRKENS